MQEQRLSASEADVVIDRTPVPLTFVIRIARKAKVFFVDDLGVATMVSRIFVLVMLLFALTGCRFSRTGDGEASDYRNEPASREQAAALMMELDDRAVEENWPEPGARRVREQMRGRLLVAGVSPTEINEWIDAGEHTYTNR